MRASPRRDRCQQRPTQQHRLKHSHPESPS
jgi:hypothetical protein